MVTALEPPRVQLMPAAADYGRGRETVELSRSCGLELDGWQSYIVENSLGLRDDEKFAAFEVGVNVARQNGKGVILEARELGGIFVFGEKLITHSSHQQDTSLEAMRRLMEAIEEGGLQSELKGTGARWANGQEAILFKSGQRIRFRTRSKGAGRGFSGQCLIFDEAMYLPEVAVKALIPIMSAQLNPQLWYAGSAVDQEDNENGVAWARVRERGIAGDDPSLAYFEWSAPFDTPNEVPIDLDMDLVKRANPALEIRISPEYVEKERRAMDARGFAVERLGVGDWPRTDGVAQTVLPVEDWDALADPESEVLDPVVLAFDVGPQRTASIAAAGKRADGLWHVEIIENRTGTSWLPKRLAEYIARHEPTAVVCDAYGPVKSLLHDLEGSSALIGQDATETEVQTLTAGEHVQACGRLVDAVADKLVRHLGTDELTAAVRGAKPRPLGDAWAWSRKNSSVDISPLVAATLALGTAMDDPTADLAVY